MLLCVEMIGVDYEEKSDRLTFRTNYLDRGERRATSMK